MQLTPHSTQPLAAIAHQATSSPFHIGTGLPLADLQNSLSHSPMKQSLMVTASRLHEQHFIGLIELACKLGLENECQNLFAYQTSVCLRDFLNRITERLQQAVEKQVKEKVQAMFCDLFDTLTTNKVTFDKDQLETLIQAGMNDQNQNGTLGHIEIGINDSDNTNFDIDDKIYLSIQSEDNTVYSLDAPKCELAQSLLQVLYKRSTEALLMMDCEALCYYNHELSQVCDSLLDRLYKQDFTNCEELYEALIEDGNCELVYWFGGDDDEQMKEQILPLIEIVVDMYQEQHKDTPITFLSQWFERHFVALDDNAYELVSHNEPVHFVSTNVDYINTLMENEFGGEEYDSRLLLTPNKAIETLVAIAMNRNMVITYEMLTFYGNEEQLNKSFCKAHGITPSSYKLFVS